MATDFKMKKSDLILLLLKSKNKIPIEGITRFEKLIFLAQKEIFEKWDKFKSDFNFEADRFGPLSTEIYDELDFLKSVGMVDEGPGKSYKITEKGVRFTEAKVKDRVPEKIQKALESLKEEHGTENLNYLLKYVYTKFPEYTVKSEIRDKILG